MQIDSIEVSLHKMFYPICWEKYEKYYKMLSAEIFTQQSIKL